jgi:hypothetical protein
MELDLSRTLGAIGLFTFAVGTVLLLAAGALKPTPVNRPSVAGDWGLRLMTVGFCSAMLVALTDDMLSGPDAGPWTYVALAPFYVLAAGAVAFWAGRRFLVDWLEIAGKIAMVAALLFLVLGGLIGMLTGESGPSARSMDYWDPY